MYCYMHSLLEQRVHKAKTMAKVGVVRLKCLQLKCLGLNQPPIFCSVYKSTMCEVPLLRPPPGSYLTVKCVNENSNP